MKDRANPTSLLAARPTYIRHLVLAALCVITTINYIQRNSLGGAETTIRADLRLTRNDTGDAMGAFFLTYALCQVPSGWLAQRWGGRLALTLYAAGWSLVMAFTAAATNLPALIGARWVMGALQAGVFPCCTLILASWYPDTRRGFASAVLNSFMLAGGVIASWMTAQLIGPLGWRWLFLLYAVPGLAWVAWFAIWFRNRPQDHPAVNAAELAIISPQTVNEWGASTLGAAEPDERIAAHRDSLSSEKFEKPSWPQEWHGQETPQRGETVPQRGEASPDSVVASPDRATVQRVVEPSVPWLAIFFSWALGCICIQQFCRAGAMRFFDMWLPTYLQEVRGQSVASANYLTSLPLFAGIVGGIVGGILSDFVLARTGSRRAARQGVSAGGVLLGLLFYGLAYQVANLTGAVLLASCGLFFVTFGSPCSYALTMDMGGRNLGVIFATMNMAGNLGAWAFTTYFPRVVTRQGWDGALLVFVGMQIVASVCLLLFNPNGVIGEPPWFTVRAKRKPHPV